MKYIFTDFDGVLTSVHTTPGSYLKLKPEEYGMSDTCVNRLISLCERTGAVVIVSSNWRKFDDNGYWIHSSGKYYNPIPKLIISLGKHYAGMLTKRRHVSKTEALDEWMKSNTYESYVVFDDDPKEGLSDSVYRYNYIETNPVDGLTDEDCERAFTILTETR